MIIAADKAMYSVKAKHKERLPKPETSNTQIISKQLNNVRRENPVLEDSFIVELDESHVISSAIN